jgi:hypothetical protein
MPTIPITFNKGTQAPAKLGTAIVKPAGKDMMSYSQNVEVQSDEYGNGVLVPGPALVTIGNNSELTGVPYVKAFWGSASQSAGYLYFAEGLLGATNKIRRIKDVISGSTPVIDTSDSLTVTHTAHATVVVDDMVIRNDGTNAFAYYVGQDATDGWIKKIQADTGTFSSTDSTISTLTANVPGSERKLLNASDGNIYIGHYNHIDSVSMADAYTNNVLDLKPDWGVTALAEWRLRMAIAYSDTRLWTFSTRKYAGTSGIVLWNFIDPSFEEPIKCPSRYISAVVNDPDGSLLVFGGVDEGKSTIYEFTGYGFNVLYSYIGDLRRSRHSVDFDGMGRVVFQTADGQWCRFDKRSGIFEHLGTITTGSSAGGVFTRLLGGTGNEFFAASGTGSTYTGKRVTFGSYIGDGDSSDGVTTPLAISGQVSLPRKSIVTGIELNFNKNLESGEKVEARLYKNGSTSTTTLGTASFTTDGAISNKNVRGLETGVDNAAVGIAWKMTDASTTAPGIESAFLHYNEIKTL